ncbi:uncharacterized protein LOC102704985 isoform X2 [Oryza brachyantha]|uniref:Uncharacterized protein n=1 Tax=Oryza brachyantha TaxID=4533 RepID=J3MFB5_ORYBR|nr:uncharacterized protein LOC102704985 isoform X2 [Oryza brachyantha]
MVADHICSVESGMIVESREVEKVVVIGEASADQIVGDVGATMGGVMAGGVLKNSQPACCVDLGRSVPLSNNGAAMIHREKTTTHTEEELNYVLSIGSDTYDINLLKKKYKSLKRKHLKCNKFIPNAKKFRCAATEAACHGGPGLYFKAIVDQNASSPSFDAIKDGIASALDHFHEEHSRRFTASLQDLSHVLSNLFPSKRRTSPVNFSRDQVDSKAGELAHKGSTHCCTSNNGTEILSKSKSVTQSDEETVKLPSSGSQGLSPIMDEVTQKLTSSTGTYMQHTHLQNQKLIS